VVTAFGPHNTGGRGEFPQGFGCRSVRTSTFNIAARTTQQHQDKLPSPIAWAMTVATLAVLKSVSPEKGIVHLQVHGANPLVPATDERGVW
jgi:hypothetical protein